MVRVCPTFDTFNPMKYGHSVRSQRLMMSCKNRVCQIIKTVVTVGTLIRFTTALDDPSSSSRAGEGALTSPCRRAPSQARLDDDVSYNPPL